jgi:hypothetical protein
MGRAKRRKARDEKAATSDERTSSTQKRSRGRIRVRDGTLVSKDLMATMRILLTFAALIATGGAFTVMHKAVRPSTKLLSTAEESVDRRAFLWKGAVAAASLAVATPAVAEDVDPSQVATSKRAPVLDYKDVANGETLDVCINQSIVTLQHLFTRLFTYVIALYQTFRKPLRTTRIGVRLLFAWRGIPLVPMTE